MKNTLKQKKLILSELKCATATIPPLRIQNLQAAIRFKSYYISKKLSCMKKILLSFLLVIPFSILAQSKVSFHICTDYLKTTNRPTSYYGLDNQPIKSTQLCMYVLANASSEIQSNIMCNITKLLSSGGEENSQTFYLYQKSERSAQANKTHCFLEAGTYRVSIYQQYDNAAMINDYTKNILFEQTVMINLEENPANKLIGMKGRMYYFGSKTEFSEIINDQTQKPSERFKLKDGELKLKLNVSNLKELQLTELKTKIYSYTPKGTPAEITNKVLYQEQSYKVPDKTWKSVSIATSIKDPNNYVIEFYTQDDTFIVQGFIKVK